MFPDGRGWLFVGVSGAGKSTLSRLWRAEPDVRVLSDERIIVRRHDDGLWLYGTPWHGDGQIAEPGRARLERVFFLRHSPRNALAAVGVTDAITRLFVCGFTPFHDAAGLAFSLGFLENIARDCRCDELGFVPDRSAIALPARRLTRHPRDVRVLLKQRAKHTDGSIGGHAFCRKYFPSSFRSCWSLDCTCDFGPADAAWRRPCATVTS